MVGPLRHVAVLAALIAAATWPVPASGYEFEVRARTIGQGLSLRVFRPVTGNLWIDRRRFTQTLSLSIWNLGESEPRDWSRYARRRSGPRLSVHGFLRIDHDFGDWTSGTIDIGNRVLDAIDAVPELEEGAVALDVLSLYVAAEELMGGKLDVYAGRQLLVGALDWWSFDGLRARIRLPVPLAVEAFGGVRVRDSSFLASSTTELDGTASGQCREYVEGAVPGSGAWRPIDVGIPDNSAFENDLDVCPQRDELQPTFGATVSTEGLGDVVASLGYRRTMSPSPGLIGPADRFDPPDLGFYPNEDGQAPEWGVNEEHLSASVRGNLLLDRRRVQINPYAAIRYSALHGLVDQAHAGARLRYRDWALEPEVYYSFPTFDGDSIFNVFSIQPYVDLRTTITRWAIAGRLSIYLRPWARRFAPEDPSNAVVGEMLARSDWAAGIQSGARLRLGRRRYLRLDGFHDDGYGGRRIGGLLAGRWQTTKRLGFASRLSLIDFRDEISARLDGLNAGAQAGITYQIFQGVGVRGLGEYNHNSVTDHTLRVIAILDLAFRPEL